jgi:hypothetical protein
MSDWVPFFSACAGGAFALAGGWLGQRFQTEREREGRTEEREARSAAERVAFETTAIAHLQDALTALAVVTNSIHYRRMDEWGKVGTWPSVEAIGRREEYTAAELEVMRYVDRLLMRDLPDLGWKAVFAARECVNAPDDRAATNAILEMSGHLSRCVNALGDRLRDLYGEP